jgi:hypothetical protein
VPNKRINLFLFYSHSHKTTASKTKGMLLK